MTKFTKKELLILVGLILLGSFLRLYALDKYPAGFHGDEAWTGLEARRILNEGFIGFWSPSALGQTALSFYWTSIFIKFFGSTVFAVRLSFALLAITSIPFFYLTVKILYSRLTAIISTFLFITGTIPLGLSRRGDLIAASFAFFPSIFFFLQALNTNRTIYFILAGFFIGLSHHTYASFWITPIAFFFFIIYQMACLKKQFFKKYFKNLTFLFISYLVVASPIILFSFHNSESFFARSRMISVLSTEGVQHIQSYLPNVQNSLNIILYNTKATLLMFNLIPEGDVGNTGFNRPVFDHVTGIFFLLGLAITLLKFRKNLFVYIFFITFLSGSILTVDAPSFRRSEGSIYFAYIFAGIGTVWLYKFLLDKLKFNQNLLSLGGLFLITVLGLYNISQYFQNYATSQKTKDIYSYKLVKVANFINFQPGPNYIFFYSSTFSLKYETLRFLMPNVEGEDVLKELKPNNPAEAIKNKNLIYIFFPDYLMELPHIKTIYPQGRLQEHFDDNGTILFVSYLIM